MIGQVEATEPGGALAVPAFEAPAPAPLPPQAESGSCPGCGGGSGSGGYVYALGRVEIRFPSLALEKELAQATGRAQTAGQTDREALHAVLSQRQNRYLVRRLCWVFTVEGLETYILRPRDPAEYELLLEAVRPAPSLLDVDVVVGVRGPIAPPELCNGLMVPIVGFDRIYSFDRETLIKAIPRPESIPARQEGSFRSAAGELFDRILQLADNAGATDEHRALNYCAVRYPAIYAKAVDAHARNYSLTGVEVRRSRLSGLRNIVDVVFSFTHRENEGIEKHFVRVDVTEEFPFLATRLSPYFDR